MSFLDRQINHTRRRLSGNVLLQRLSIGVLLAAGLWALTIIIVRLFALNLPLWQGGWIAALVALLVGVIGLAIARPSALQAAVELDSAAGLKERLSTALLVRRDTDPFVRAAVEDAEKVASHVHVPTHIRYRAPALWPWSAATVLAALILAWLMPTVDLLADETDPEAHVPRAVVEAEHKVIKAEFDKKLGQIKELAQGDRELKAIIEDIEPMEMPEHPTVTPDDIRQDAVRRIDDIRDRLKEKLEADETNSLKQTKRLFQQLNPPGSQKADNKLAQALANGDFKGAQEALRELAKKMDEAAQNANEPEAQQKLAQMQQQLQQMADQLAKLGDTVELQKELEEKGLSEEEARKLLEQMAKTDPKQLEKELQKRLGEKGLSQKQIQELAQKIRQQQKKMQQQQQARQNSQNLSQALQKAAQACQQCRTPGSTGSGGSQPGNALSDAISQLSDLEVSEQLMNELEAQISDFQNMRDDICQGGMNPGYQQPGRRPQGPIGSQGPNAGLGLGARIGKEKVPYQRDPTKAKSRFQSGTIIGRILVEGPQVRGEATDEEYDAVNSEVRDALDAVAREEVPRQYQKAVQAYFERLAGIMRKQQTEEDSPQADE
ncbi:MAG: hypothetical protein KAY37_17305 [Phycisphaerae bacterium]|nr:hypothetical protein [Phycisphaerae bacterium]